MEHEHTQYVAASPDNVYAALADVSNLPRFVPQMTAASRGEGGSGTVEGRYEGPTQEGKGWVRGGAGAGGPRLTLFLATAHGDAPDSGVRGTLDAIRRLVEASA